MQIFESSVQDHVQSSVYKSLVKGDEESIKENNVKGEEDELDDDIPDIPLDSEDTVVGDDDDDDDDEDD